MASKTLFKKVIDQSVVINCQRPLTKISGLYDWVPKDKETHTGQKWEDEDFRMARFVDKEKQVNPNWSVKLIAAIPPKPIKGRYTSCDGGSGPTGHPIVFINLDKPGSHRCLYCGLKFYKDCLEH